MQNITVISLFGHFKTTSRVTVNKMHVAFNTRRMIRTWHLL